MFQDNKPSKPESPKNIKAADDFQDLEDSALNSAKSKAEKKLQNANSNIKKVSDKASQINSVAGSAQGASAMFMNQDIHTNNAMTSEGKVWSQQPTSKIHNANAIPSSQILGINRVVRLDVVIEGKLIKHFKHFELKQSAVRHHQFSLMLAHDSLGSAENHNLEEAQNFLGKRLTVIFKYKDVADGPERNFVGVITEVGFSQEKGNLGNIVLTGFSPTVLLDAAPHIQSFGGSQEISLNSIADRVIKEGLGGNKFDFRVDAKHGNVSYSSQYEETHYNYLARIAEAYGEQFFYDGEVLHFGKLPPSEQPVKLTYGSSVSDVKIKMKAQHVNPTFYGYNSSKNEKLTTGSSKIAHTSDIAKRAYEISEKTFTTPSLRVAPIKASSFMDVDASQKGTAGSNASQVFVTSGTTTVPFLYPGCAADIEMRQTESSQTSYFTKLMITEVSHVVDARGYYTGNFEAIAADCGYIPRPEFEVPKADAQFAKVISNTDPQNQGRVQVQFDWQSGSDTSEFIRVMTPDAGGSDKVSKNRGFMAIPEVGDQVVVNFAHQHPDRPFVMGGMFHGGVGGGGGTGNNIKSLSSRSGNKLELDDGAGSVFLTDQGGANMKFDGAGNATTNTNNDKTVTVGNNNAVNVTNNNTIKAGNTNMIDVGGNSVFQMDKSGNVSFTATTEFKIVVGASTIVIDKTGMITINGKEIKVDATQSINLSATNETTVGGKNVKVTGSTEVQISGDKVNINK
ncbi:phage baseplate assembly protein V [Chryseobacterium wangxinyae]|uniref:type VI secretion system Vgr family protein n=1 Tax=Chryseobacterium sp. CY350 TaxID=2997336 RepID=UPI00227219DA|nr:phage baseplate assembly protein V [Chryseobacterium sp. CY350]MCY0976722.1 phage baseplate assembly protein V [Chryseobacterium sp. CY350]WBZ96723.1 phage baseplate assembly protein V [Chryseobacterium sp. CY350]